MTLIDYIILGIVAVLFAAALISIIRRLRRGETCCGCSACSCSKSCPGCKNRNCCGNKHK